MRLGLDDEADDPDQTVPVARSATGGGTHRTDSSRQGWQPPTVEQLQQALPQYEISALIACGGMGAVYKGTQRALNRPVAIKILPPEMEADTGDLQFAARFKQEAQAMARLSHPNIVAVFDAGAVGNLLFFVMEFIEGTDVAQLIASEGRLEAARAIQIISAVCDALAFAHEEGIVHRDIKPSNIMIDKRGRVKVADFGLAKAVNVESTLMTRSDVAMGTPDFVAPEAMIPGMKVDGRADLYAVGVMLYQMLTGAIPRGRFELPSGVIPQVDKSFDAIVDKAMQTDRDKRYSTALEIKVDLERVGTRSDGFPSGLRSQPSATPSTPAMTMAGSGRSSGKSRAPLLLGLITGILVLAAGSFFALKKPGNPPANGSSVSASPSLPVSPSSPFPLGQWVKVLTKQEDLGTSSVFKEQVRFQDGWLDANGLATAPTLVVPGFSGKDCGVRLRGRIGPKITLTVGMGIHLRRFMQVGTALQGYQCTLSSLNNPMANVGIGLQDYPDKTTERLGQLPPFPTLKSGEEFTLEFYAIGDQLHGRFNGTWLPPATDKRLTTGGIAIQTAHLIRDVEVIHLDGLSADEARKAAGIDPVSSSQSLPVSESSAPTWQAMTFPTEAATEASKRTKGSGLEDGRLGVWGNGMKGFPQQQAVKNGAVRVTMMWDAATQNPRMITRNKGNTGHYIAQLALQGVTIAKHPERGSDMNLKSFPLPQPLKPGEEFTAQFGSIGSQHYVWVNGQLLGSVTDDTLMQSGVPAVQAGDARFKRVEMLTLDGLSEAEALKAAGVGAPEAAIQ